MARLQTSMNHLVPDFANKIMMYIIQNPQLWSTTASSVFFDIKNSDVYHELNKYSHEFKTKVYEHLANNYNINYNNEHSFFIRLMW